MCGYFHLYINFGKNNMKIKVFLCFQKNDNNKFDRCRTWSNINMLLNILNFILNFQHYLKKKFNGLILRNLGL